MKIVNYLSLRLSVLILLITAGWTVPSLGMWGSGAALAGANAEIGRQKAAQERNASSVKARVDEREQAVKAAVDRLQVLHDAELAVLNKQLFNLGTVHEAEIVSLTSQKNDELKKQAAEIAKLVSKKDEQLVEQLASLNAAHAAEIARLSREKDMVINELAATKEYSRALELFFNGRIQQLESLLRRSNISVPEFKTLHKPNLDQMISLVEIA